MKVLLLSAYAAQSHVHWQRALQAMFPHWQWQVLSLPPRHFSWRIRGNALYWSIAEREALEQHHDLLIATSMVDLATLRGLVPSLTRLPTVLYFHENQFDYPQHGPQRHLVEAQITSLYSALAADRVVFNSHYNQDSFLAGCAALLRKMPDHVPPAVVPRLRERASVLPVPYDLNGLDIVPSIWPNVGRGLVGKSLRLVWVGRFEHDKGADGLLRILQQLETRGVDYELAMCGQQFRQTPAVFADIQATFAHRIVHFGYLEDPMTYHALLQAADAVLSTANHEFQGLAVMEAVARGCLPIVPARLAYPEIYPTQCCYASHPEDLVREAASAVALIVRAVGNSAASPAIAPDMAPFSTGELASRYACLLDDVVAGVSPSIATRR